MLGKLFRHEMKATAQMFIPLYAGLVAFSFIVRLFNSNSGTIDLLLGNTWFAFLLYAVVAVIYSVLLFAVFVMAFVVMMQRFRKNLLGDEGYLMNTLPVEPWMHIGAKLSVSAIWGVASVIMATLSAMILIAQRNLLSDIRDGFRFLVTEFAELFDVSKGMVVTEGILMTLAVIVNIILMVYAAIVLGHQWKRHKTIGAFCSYGVLLIITQIINRTVFKLLYGENSFFQCMIELGGKRLNAALWTSLILTLLFSAGYFAITNYLLKNRLNLE